MAEPKRKFTREFKLEAVRLVASGDKPLAQVARELGILPNLLRNWRRQVEGREGQPPADVFPGHGQLPGQDEELRRLRSEVETLRQERDFLKKRRSTSPRNRDEVRRHQSPPSIFPVALMCRVLEVSRSGFYAAQWRSASARAKRDEELRTQVRVIYQASRRTYGSPRVHAELQAQGERCGRKRIARLMRKEGLRVKVRRRFRPTTTDSKHTHRVAPNMLDRRFAVTEIEATNRVWAGDITYMPTREGWLYLAVILDLASRRVVGWSMRRTLEASLVIDALRMAVEARCPGSGLLHHSDRGVQYASLDYQELLARHRIVVSMSRRANCYDNAVVESFFATLEWELIDRCDWRTRDEARLVIFEYIECWYNQKRRHSSLGYFSPVEYERQLSSRAA